MSSKLIKTCLASTYTMPQLEGIGAAGKVSTQSKKKTVEDIEREAFEKGFTSGEKAGYELGKKKADLLIRRLENILTELNNLKSEIVADLEPQVLLLGITLAKKILKEELSLHPEIIGEMVKEALNKICKTGPVTIKVNQSLIDYLGKKKEEFSAIYPDLRLELDNQIPDGGAVVSCLSEEVQTDLSFQLSNIIEDLRANLGNG